MGTPEHSPDDRVVLNIKLSRRERDTVHFGARLRGLTAADLARATLLASAREAVEQAGSLVVALDGGPTLRD
jgi:hypothetical protein